MRSNTDRIVLSLIPAAMIAVGAMGLMGWLDRVAGLVAVMCVSGLVTFQFGRMSVRGIEG